MKFTSKMLVERSDLASRVSIKEQGNLNFNMGIYNLKIHFY